MHRQQQRCPQPVTPSHAGRSWCLRLWSVDERAHGLLDADPEGVCGRDCVSMVFVDGTPNASEPILQLGGAPITTAGAQGLFEHCLEVCVRLGPGLQGADGVSLLAQQGSLSEAHGHLVAYGHGVRCLWRAPSGAGEQQEEGEGHRGQDTPVWPTEV